MRCSFCFQLVLGLPPPPSIRTFELYGPVTVFVVQRCHLGRTDTYYFILIIFYFILFYSYFRLNSPAMLLVERKVTRMIDFSEAVDRFATLKTRRVTECALWYNRCL